MGNPTPPPSTQIATIPDLPTASALNGAELIWINQAGLDRSAAVSAVAALGGAGVYLPLTGGNLSGSLSVSGSLTVGGSASGTTPNAGDNSAAFATTAFVQNAIAGVAGVSSFNGRNGAVSLTQADVTGVGGATAAQLANYLPLAGGAISGALSVGGGLTATTRAPGDSTTNVATTAFVAGALPLASTTTPPMDGTAAVGTGTTWARADHVHPTDTSRAAASALAGYLPLTGGTLTGPLTVSVPGGNNLYINGAAGTQRGIFGQTNGVNRWLVNLGDAAAETGSNAGSNFSVVPIPDSGTGAIITAFTINRANGYATFGAQLTVQGGLVQSPAQTFTQTSTQPTHVLNKTTTSGNSWIMGSTNGNNRWLLYLADSTAETGSNVGGNAALVACTDAGAYNISAWSVARNTGVVTFSQPIVNGSDLRQKREITPIGDALALIKQLAGVTYERHTRPGRREHGLIAQDLMKVVPEAVEECCPEPVEAPNPIGTPEEPLLGISYTQLTPLLIEAVKELAAEVEALKTRAATGVPLI